MDRHQDRDSRFPRSIWAQVRLRDPQMVGRAPCRPTEPGHARPRMTGRQQRLRISDSRYYLIAQHLYPDII